MRICIGGRIAHPQRIDLFGDRRFLQPPADECCRVLQRNAHQPGLAQAHHDIDQRVIVDVRKVLFIDQRDTVGQGNGSNTARSDRR